MQDKIYDSENVIRGKLEVLNNSSINFSNLVGIVGGIYYARISQSSRSA
ncbi:hypothetical protein [Nostoc parmelioides]|uniref:Uncharacterized protein n=1 Tax=Nostoc parmelioides FACHB-3921 TaxID=2692909 RepID=A0ABR8BPJ4_9NOSO|nr:hypothetical protein [Nostoc parmelioides]MBD2254711.1 hypothetical protein [Nostoc parmelioides FACHB-3921]